MSHEFGPGEYKTRSGGEAIVDAVVPETDTGDTLLGRVRLPSGYYRVATWKPNGKMYHLREDDEEDLLPPAPPGRFVNVYEWEPGESCSSVIYPSPESAEKNINLDARHVGIFRLVPVDQ